MRDLEVVATRKKSTRVGVSADTGPRPCKIRVARVNGPGSGGRTRKWKHRVPLTIRLSRNGDWCVDAGEQRQKAGTSSGAFYRQGLASKCECLGNRGTRQGAGWEVDDLL